MTQQDGSRLIILNADDLGLAPGVTRGILELARCGVVTSASLIPNLPGSASALSAAREAGLDVGTHLTICTGAPLSPPQAVPSLLRPDGRFIGASELTRRRMTGRLRLDDVEREWSAQIEWFLAAGVRPSHLDTHCHVHAFAGLDALLLRLARHYGVPAVRRAISGYVSPLVRPSIRRRITARRVGMPARPYRGDYFTVLTHLAPLRHPVSWMLRALPPGVTEIACHPGHVDDELRRLDTLTDPREREWRVLMRPSFRALLEREGIQLASWADVAASMTS